MSSAHYFGCSPFGPMSGMRRSSKFKFKVLGFLRRRACCFLAWADVQADARHASVCPVVARLLAAAPPMARGWLALVREKFPFWCWR